MKHEALTGKIIQCFYSVYNQLGYGFLESVYQKAMLIEEGKQGLLVETQVPISVYYDDKVIGEFLQTRSWRDSSSLNSRQ